MNRMAAPLLFCAITLVGLTLYACTGLESTSGDNGSREYSKDYEQMKKVVKQAIRNANMEITYVDESESNSITFLIGRKRFVNNEEIQVEKGEVRVTRLSEEKTRVEVENPDYHFSVPRHQKEDYQRILFGGIDSILESG